jgi:hypothetical protein
MILLEQRVRWVEEREEIEKRTTEKRTYASPWRAGSRCIRREGAAQYEAGSEESQRASDGPAEGINNDEHETGERSICARAGRRGVCLRLGKPAEERLDGEEPLAEECKADKGHEEGRRGKSLRPRPVPRWTHGRHCELLQWTLAFDQPSQSGWMSERDSG